jgi:Zn-finger nucleic acid-binding protein
MIPNCNHYITPELIIGKYSICPECQQEFIINKAATQRVFPKCADCKGKVELRGAVKDLVEKSKGSSSAPPKELTNISADILKKFGIT